MKIITLIISIIICIASVLFAGLLILAAPLAALSDSPTSQLLPNIILILSIVVAVGSFIYSLKIARSLKQLK